MRVRKAKGIECACNECKMKGFLTCATRNVILFEFCTSNVPEDAYLEKPNVGGKDQHK